MRSEILIPLFNTLTAAHMHSSHIWENLTGYFQTELSENSSIFSDNFIAFSKSTWNFEYLENKIIFVASRYLKLFLRNNVVNPVPSNSCFRTTLGNQRVNVLKTLLWAAQQHFYANFILISSKLSCLWCLILRSEILGPLFNTLTAAHMHCCHNWQKLTA